MTTAATQVKAEGFAYSATTRDWTDLVEYVARDNGFWNKG